MTSTLRRVSDEPHALLERCADVWIGSVIRRQSGEVVATPQPHLLRHHAPEESGAPAEAVRIDRGPLWRANIQRDLHFVVVRAKAEAQQFRMAQYRITGSAPQASRRRF